MLFSYDYANIIKFFIRKNQGLGLVRDLKVYAMSKKYLIAILLYKITNIKKSLYKNYNALII